MLKTLLLAVNKFGTTRISKAKLATLFAAVVNFLQELHVFDLSSQQWTAVNTLLGALIVIFIRDAMDPTEAKL